MKTVTYDIIIDRISEPFGAYPGTVEVNHHIEGGDLGAGSRDAFETTRVALTIECINEDGAFDHEQINYVVVNTLGKTSVIELEEDADAAEYVIQDIKTGWYRALDSMPNTLWTPERNEAQGYKSHAEAAAELSTLHPDEILNAKVMED